MSAARKFTDLTITGFSDSVKSESGIIYGPVANGPFGTNLGVNLLGMEKACSFDCPYCDLGQTGLRLNKIKSEASLPPLADIERAIQNGFQKIHAVGPVVDGIVVSGNGEPTLHPDFPEIIKFMRTARDSWMPGKPIHLFTNGATLDQRKIHEAANSLETRIVKIDAGNEKMFKVTAAPLSRTNLAKVLSGTRKLKDVIVQSVFYGGDFTNTNQSDLDDWLEVIAILKPKAVHIYGVGRTPAQSGVIRLDEDTIYSIASRLERKTQIKAIVIP